MIKDEVESSLDHTKAGFLVANDPDRKRLETLRNRYARCGSPHLILTSHTAQELVEVFEPRGVLFDRILCDVPCSGDGTFRKQPHLWRLFRPRVAIELHTLQLSIARAALRLLRPGGRMVYSTCSLNPIENEAVVAALLRESGGRLTLVDMRASPRGGRSHVDD
eukprot:gene4471-5670_t